MSGGGPRDRSQWLCRTYDWRADGTGARPGLTRWRAVVAGSDNDGSATSAATTTAATARPLLIILARRRGSDMISAWSTPVGRLAIASRAVRTSSAVPRLPAHHRGTFDTSESRLRALEFAARPRDPGHASRAGEEHDQGGQPAGGADPGRWGRLPD